MVSKKSGTMSLGVRLGAIMGVFALLIVGIVGITYWVTSAQKTDSVIANLAGRQRMLTQKFNKEFLDEVNDRQVVASAAQRAATAASQIVADRNYYTKNIIGKLKKQSSDFKAGANYHEVKGSIPLPATFVREVSQLLPESAKYRYDLLSKYNINKDKGLRTEFENRAWEALVRDPKTPFTDLVAAGQGVELRHATADVAGVNACVSCHNNHPESPKTDFKLNDLMGLLVVTVPVTQDATLAQQLLSAEASTQESPCEKTQELFETTLTALRQGGTTFSDLSMTQPVSIPANTDPDIEAKYAAVATQWKELQNTVTATRAIEADFSSAEFVGNIRTIRERGMACLTNMNSAVATVQAVSEARATLGQNLQYCAVALAAITFVCVLFYIRRRITGPITQIIAGLTEGADQVNDAAGQVSSSSQQLAQGSSEQAASLEETSSALEQVAAMTRTNAQNARQANDLSDQARNAARSGDETMEQLNDAMTAINESSGKISKIIKVIEEIAFQTNLLALNAAVEAARAGEHGKGFAVVADEVRNLAQRAAKAAQETTGLIDDSVNRAKEGTDVAGKVGNALGEIVADVTKVADLVNGITKASDEQAQGVDQVNTAVSEMDKITQQNAAGAEESASASEQLSAQAATVQSTVDDLAVLIGGKRISAKSSHSAAKQRSTGERPSGGMGTKTSGTHEHVSAHAEATATSQASDDFPALEGDDLKGF